MKAQLIFGWFEDSLNRSVVRSLCVWKPEVVRDNGKCFGGQQSEVAYSSWLKWFTPLSHSDFAHVVVE